MECQKATGFLKNAYYQGHGRFVNQIIRMTLKFCKSSGSSREMRRFIETRLVDVARENPGCVIYMKPRLFKTPVMTAEYLNGNSHYLNFHKMSAKQIEAWIGWFLTRSGQELYKMHRPITTYKPSIQGIWSPYTFRPSELNITEFPSEELSRHIPQTLSATDQLVKIAKATKEGQERQQQ